jgi:dihydropteroate synthase
MKRSFTININGELMILDSPKIMGILNITPDSFYSGSRVSSASEVLSRAEKMLLNGADFLDIGGYSSKPGAEDVSVDEEINRVIPVISIDTFRSSVAMAAINAGASLINDISGGDGDPEMFQTVKKLKVPYIIMHMQGTPKTMQKSPSYRNVVQDVYRALSLKLNELRLLGVTDVIVDVGFGFGKTMEHNYELLANLDYFHSLECPVIVGISRKSMVYKALDITPEESLNGTVVLNTIATQKGVQILRVHDVKEAKEMLRLYSLTNLS